MKYVLASEGVLLWNRHLDQLVICSLYIAIKANQIPLRFNDLVASYEKTATQSRILTRKIVSCVWVHAVDEPHRSSTIIEFYNKVFVPALRPFIPSMKNPYF